MRHEDVSNWPTFYREPIQDERAENAALRKRIGDLEEQVMALTMQAQLLGAPVIVPAPRQAEPTVPRRTQCPGCRSAQCADCNPALARLRMYRGRSW